MVDGSKSKRYSKGAVNRKVAGGWGIERGVAREKRTERR